jgi:hypothetical protein
MTQINRPSHDALERRIRYADSPNVDTAGNPVIYEIDHSDPAKWNQTTGIETGTRVAIAITRDNETTTPQVATPTGTAGPTALIRNAATGGLDEPTALEVPAGTNVRDARMQYARKYGTPEGAVAYLGGQEVGDDLKLQEGDIILMKVPMKDRG